MTVECSICKRMVEPTGNIFFIPYACDSCTKEAQVGVTKVTDTESIEPVTVADEAETETNALLVDQETQIRDLEERLEEAGYRLTTAGKLFLVHETIQNEFVAKLEEKIKDLEEENTQLTQNLQEASRMALELDNARINRIESLLLTIFAYKAELLKLQNPAKVLFQRVRDWWTGV